MVTALSPASHEDYGGVSLPSAQQGEAVRQLTIDSLNLSACHIIKLDAEGMDTEALNGTEQTVRHPDNFRAAPYNMLGGTISINMLCVPTEIDQLALSVLREVSDPPTNGVNDRPASALQDALL